MNNQIVINSQLISYLHNETAGNICLLFLHGWRSQKEVWGRVIKDLGSDLGSPRRDGLKIKDISVYALDLSGFGGSSAPRNSWNVGDYAEVVKGFIEKLELKNVILIGHSFGGRVGVKLTASQARNYAEPNAESHGKTQSAIQKLILVDSAGFAAPSSRKNFMTAAAKIVKPVFKPKFMQGLRRKIYKTIGAEDYVATPELKETFKNIIGEDLTEDMKHIKIPTLIVWGENDLETPLEFGRKMNSIIHNSKFIILPSAGHFSFLDRPEEFVKALQEFINTDQPIIHE